MIKDYDIDDTIDYEFKKEYYKVVKEFDNIFFELTKNDKLTLFFILSHIFQLLTFYDLLDINDEIEIKGMLYCRTALPQLIEEKKELIKKKISNKKSGGVK